MACLTDSRRGITAEDLEAILRDADPLEVVELLTELDHAL